MAAIGSHEAGSPDSTPPEDWMMESCSTKRAEKEPTVDGVAKRPKAARSVVVAEAGAGIKAEEEDRAKPAWGKKTRRVRVKQEYIDWLLAHPPKPFRGIPQELMDKDISKHRESLRTLMAHVAASHKEARDKDLAILEQYQRQGYAEEEIEVRDDDVEGMAVGN